MNASAQLARRLALATSALLLAGAYLGEFVFGLYPCEMCWWQRYPHFAAVALALLAFVAAPKRVWTALAGLAILASGLIGAYHAGIEYGWWQGLTACTGAPSAEGGNALEAILAAPMVRCDKAAWDFLGISLAGWNFLVSTAAALAIFALLRRKAA